LAEKTFDSSGKCIADKDKTARYDQADALYGRFLVKETKVSSEEIEAAGRKWKTRVYVNRRTVEAQEQVLRIWNSMEQPGLVVRTLFKSPRLEWEGVLTSFQQPQKSPGKPGGKH
jgi:hypothetical protein